MSNDDSKTLDFAYFTTVKYITKRVTRLVRQAKVLYFNQLIQREEEKDGEKREKRKTQKGEREEEIGNEGWAMHQTTGGFGGASG